MQNLNTDVKGTLFFVFFLFSLNSYSQLGACQGNSGDPIFTEDFSSGTSNNSLPAGTTTYNYINGFPNDGFYTVSNGTFGNGFDWHQIEDHTVGDTDGKCLVVNASFTAGEFYRTSIDNLCENTTYEFSGWLVNLVIANSFCSTQPGGTIPVNVRFEIWDSSDTNLLASGDTGDIVETSSPIWQNFALVFQTLPAQTSVILKMINNGSGGCGNDLAIDDIEFKTCGDSIEVLDSNGNNNTTICSSETFSDTLTAVPDNSVFSSHFYQWQTSSDGISWTDIPGETNASISVTNVSATTYYRAKVAEFQANLGNDDCITLSDVYIISVNQIPVVDTLSDVQECDSYVLPIISNGDYFSDPNGGGMLLNAGDFVTASQTIYIFSDDGTCTNESSFDVTIFPQIDFDLSESNIDIDGDTITVSMTDLSINYIYAVDNSAFQTDPTFTGVSEGDHILTVADENMCVVKQVTFTISLSEPFIPQGISPGVSPGLNDNFDLSGFDVAEIKIYNRYGTLVYRMQNYTNQWQGQTNDGNDLPVGNYYYVMFYNGNTQKRTGWVYLNR